MKHVESNTSIILCLAIRHRDSLSSAQVPVTLILTFQPFCPARFVLLPSVIVMCNVEILHCAQIGQNVYTKHARNMLSIPRNFPKNCSAGDSESQRNQRSAVYVSPPLLNIVSVKTHGIHDIQTVCDNLPSSPVWGLLTFAQIIMLVASRKVTQYS